jgi:SAM-dependent methyltransferase
VSGGSLEAFLDPIQAGVTAIREILGDGVQGRVLDFGCGCGRTARHWYGQDLDLHGCDYNPQLVVWCQENLPFMQAIVNDRKPPSPYPADSFDLVYAMSVLTHLTEQSQQLWLEEWRRILKPGGLLLFTTHGDTHSQRLGKREKPRYDAGELVVRHPRIEGLNMCVALHPPSYVRERLLADWDLVRFQRASYYLQDMWLARPRA